MVRCFLGTSAIIVAVGAEATNAVVSVVDAGCPSADDCGLSGGICYEVRSWDFWNDCLADESPVARALIENPHNVAGMSCEALGFKPLGGSLPSGDPFPCGTSVPDFCYGGCTRSLVNVYVTDQDWFVREMLDSGKFNPDADCPAWQSRNPQCMAPEKHLSEKHLTVGSPGVSFHQVANWIVVRALQRVGYTVDVVDNMPHREMYPKFVAGEIDIVTGSDLPFNHAPWLWNHTDDFYVAGTVNEATDIVLGAPSDSGIVSVSELVTAKADFRPEILSLDTDTCPQCVMMGREFADSMGFTLREVTSEQFQKEVTESMEKQEKFVVSWYVPGYLQQQVNGLVNLVGDVAPWTRHNAGKILARHDINLDADARAILASVFVGNAAIQDMDVMVNVEGKSPDAAADKWIEQNPEMWESFFGRLAEPQSAAQTIISV